MFYSQNSKLMTKKNAPIPVVIDCDPGADDFFALIWAMIMHKKWLIDIVAITTAWWNVAAQATYENAIRACMMMGVQTKIGKWKDAKWAENASHIHGNDGVGWLSAILPPVTKQKNYDSEQLLLYSIKKHKGTLEILVLGPVSNLARIEKKTTGILKQAKRIISMGGAFFVPGNVSPVAEFNVRYDPKSAKAMYNSGANIVTAPLDITTQTIFTMQDLQPLLKHVNNPKYQDFLTKLTEFTIGTNMMFRETHYRRGFFVHDSNTVGFLLYPHLYKWSFHEVQVETTGEYTSGQTVIDTRNHPKTQTNAFIITDIDAKWFMEAMTEDFKEFDFAE